MKIRPRFFLFRSRARRSLCIAVLLLATAAALTICPISRSLELWRGIVDTISRNVPPQETKRFTTLPPGAKLPSEADCTSRVRRSPWEPRPENYEANHRVPTTQQIASLQAFASPPGILRKQITGNFTGTTDEILQWVACKWDIDEDLVRAQAETESDWFQSYLGDFTDNQDLCPPGTGYPGAWNGTGCYQSFGILQIKYLYNQSAWPMSRDDTAFSAEYAYAVIRACYEGQAIYLNDRKPLDGYPSYHSGDIWGCIGSWFSGNWYDQDAIDYINRVKATLKNKTWLLPGF